MDDPYEWKEHKARLGDASVLLLIYAVLLGILVLIEPLPRRDRDPADHAILLSLRSGHAALAQRKVSDGRDDNRNTRLPNRPADAGCNQQRLPADTMLPCDDGR